MNSFSLFQASIRPVLIGLMLWYCGAPRASAADYVVAVDVSGSMNWSLLGKKAQITPQNPVRIEVARKYLLDYLDSLPVRLAVIRSDESRDFVTQSIRASALNPVADFAAPVDAKEGQEVSKTIGASAISPPTPAPQARFRWRPADPKAETEIDFTDESTGLVESHNWDFNGEGHSSETSPKFTFAKPGQKVIRLVVGGPGDGSIKEETLSVAPRFIAPAAKIIVSKKSGTAPLHVKFQSEITGDYSWVHWTFGDGQTSTAPNPAHSFSAPGKMEVRLTVIPRDPSQVPAVASVVIKAKRPLSVWFWLALEIALLLIVPILLFLLIRIWLKNETPAGVGDLKEHARVPETTKRSYTDEEGRTFTIVPENSLAILLATVSILYLLGVLVFLFRELFELYTGNYKRLLCGLLYRDSYKALLDSPDFRILAYAMIGGAMGGVVNGIRSFLDWHCEAAGFGWRYIWKYVTYPVLGAALPFFVYALLRGGMGAVSADIHFDSPNAGRSFAVLGVGVLSGFGARDVCRWLDFQVRHFFDVKQNLIGVPNVIGQTASEAKATIERAGLTLGPIEGVNDAANRVLRQDPPPAAQVVPKASISVTVGKRS